MSLSELYGFIVHSCKVSPKYFFDEMTPSEVSALTEAYYKAYKEKWEMHRSVIHSVVASQSSKPIKATDIMKFDWDKESKAKSTAKMSDEDLARIKKKFNKN